MNVVSMDEWRRRRQEKVQLEEEVGLDRGMRDFIEYYSNRARSEESLTKQQIEDAHQKKLIDIILDESRSKSAKVCQFQERHAKVGGFKSVSRILDYWEGILDGSLQVWISQKKLRKDEYFEEFFDELLEGCVYEEIMNIYSRLYLLDMQKAPRFLHAQKAQLENLVCQRIELWIWARERLELTK